MDRRLRELYRRAQTDTDAIPAFLSSVKRSGFIADTDALVHYINWRAEEQSQDQPFAQALKQCHIPTDERLVAIIRLLEFLSNIGTPAQCSNYSAYPRPYEGGDVDNFFVFLRTRIGWDVVRPSWDEPASYYSHTDPEFLGWCRIQILGQDLYRLSASNQVLYGELSEEILSELDDIRNSDPEMFPWAAEEQYHNLLESYIGSDMNFEELTEHLTNERPLTMSEYVEYFAPHLQGVLHVDFDRDFDPNSRQVCFPASFPLDPISMGDEVKYLMEQRDALLPPLDNYELLFCIRRTADIDRVSVRPSDPLWQQIINPEGSNIQFRDVVAATRVEWMWEQFGQDLTWNQLFQAFMRSMAQEFEQNVLFCGHLRIEPIFCEECGEYVCPECYEDERCHG